MFPCVVARRLYRSSATPPTPPLSKFIVLNPTRSFHLVLAAVLFALSLTAAPRVSVAQTTLDTAYAIGLLHAQTAPYNFTGRVFDLDEIGIASGTLIRRQTVLTAGHVVFNPTTGFAVNTTFTRGLYENYSLSKSQAIKSEALSGYQAAAIIDPNSLAAFANDMGLFLLANAPVDGGWGAYVVDPDLLSATTSEFFVLGYPGVTFDGRTMAYIVPSSPYVQIGAGETGSYENDNYTTEGGESGGPVYVYTNGVQVICGETVGDIADPTAEFNASFIRAIDTNADQFITQAEYTGGLIRKLKIKGPKTVLHGTTVIYKVFPHFVVPDVDGTISPTTDRYTEVQLVTSTPGTSLSPAVTITKLNNTEFSVTFASTIRPKTTTTLQSYYSATGSLGNVITITVD